MQQELFFDKIKEHYTANLPFVVYRKPGESAVYSYLQLNDELQYTKDFTEGGFVFAPFNLSERVVLFSSEVSEKLQLETFNYNETDVINAYTVLTEEEHLAHVNLVAKGVEALTANSGFKKVVLSRKEVLKTEKKDPLLLFQRILHTYPNAFCYCWYHPKVGLWLGATPETLLKIYRNKLATMALAGTQKYVDTENVYWGDKEKMEQQIVTDTIVNALTPVLSNLEVSNVHTHKAGTLLHLKTDISGRLSNNHGLKEVIEALHPTPAVCGLPKEKAKAFIFNNENYRRTYYSGFLGELNNKTTVERNTNRRNVENSAYKATVVSSHLFVNLRSMEMVEDELHLFVGGGIVKDSDPEAEWQETVHKTNTMKQVLALKLPSRIK
ncbi:hypothetical protein NBRC110019_12850 [Neptunitalea chrysea]|uniref:Chorismate-utilising enzyme C-terminal domain-containing protein n=1 Tax=Neptunitalea chrysea TaxID=1647581 RepID=A0A9W6B3Y2_9FLAO|nr:chorismate-binding protein [Neptunitalea chrysea]GLB52246.1 hypothetical protein NBRC110019_12850 [Neptunitalea chrysea]